MAIALEFNEDQIYVMYQWCNDSRATMADVARWGYLATGHARRRQGRTDDEWLRDLVLELRDEVEEAIETINRWRPDAIDIADRDTLQTILVMCQDYLAD